MLVTSYRWSATGVWQYRFFDENSQLGTVTSMVGPNSIMRIEAPGISWYSQFNMDTTVIPGIARRVKKADGAEGYRIIYWREGYYEIRGGDRWIFVEHRNGAYLFGEQGMPVIAMTERISGEVSKDELEPYFRTTVYEEVELLLMMVILSFPMMRMH